MNRLPVLLPLVLALALAAPVRAEAPAPADARLAATAEAVARAHERADKLAARDPRTAAQVLERALELDYPEGEDSRALRADLFARISALHLAARDAGAALQYAMRGLREAANRPPTALTAQLHVRAGEAREKLGDDAGAVDEYARAIAVAKSLLGQRKR